MKKLDRVMREILHRFYRHGDRFFKQKELAEVCGLSLGTVNPFVKKLRLMGVIERKPLGFRLVDVRRLLIYWAATRELHRDVAYSTYVPSRPNDIEADLPDDVVRTAYTGYRELLGSTPADYDEVYVYGGPGRVRRRFKPVPTREPNLFVLKSDEHLERLSEEGVAPIAQLYVDLWQLGMRANRFIEGLDRELQRLSVRGLAEVAGEVGREEG